jgi:hypothetical protein
MTILMLMDALMFGGVGFLLGFGFCFWLFGPYFRRHQTGGTGG